MEQGVLEYERVREKKKQLLIKIQETKWEFVTSKISYNC